MAVFARHAGYLAQSHTTRNDAARPALPSQRSVRKKYGRTHQPVLRPR